MLLEYVIQNIQRVVGDTRVIGRVGNINNVTIVKLDYLDAAGNVVDAKIRVGVQNTKEVVVLHRLLVCLQIGIGLSFTVMLNQRFNLSRNSCIQSAEVFCRDVVVILVGITIHHTAGKQTKCHLMNGVIGGDNQHEVGNVGL